MFHKPARFNQYLRQHGLVNQIYTAMKSDDYSDVVMAAYNALEKCGGFPQIPKASKCESYSEKYRYEGNEAFKAGNKNKALECYNRALMHAPKNSKSMVLAYSNRSAILFKISQYKACVIDIKICFRLGCPSDIVDKLKKRMKEAVIMSTYENSVTKHLGTKCHRFFQFDVERNTQIPCASADIEVVIKDNAKKIVAAKDIKVGTLLALEPSFVSSNDVANTPFSCHYCHKMSLNLIPCEGCCCVLFCDEKCKDHCLKEYHSIECQIMEVFETIVFSPMAKLMVKGTLKFVQMCESWKEVISASRCIGSDRIRVSSVEEIFDVGNKLSVLSYNDEKLFVHGSIYVASFTCAIIIYNLEKVPSFLPRLLGERKLARQALGRLMIYFGIHAKPTIASLTVSSSSTLMTYLHQFSNHGWYPLIGKLPTTCTPNATVSNLNKKAALIALRPIEKGSELTIPSMPLLNTQYNWHATNCITFNFFGEVCNCSICNDDLKLQTKKCMLTEKQLDIYKKQFVQQNYNINLFTVHESFPKLCKLLTCLSDMPFSNEYENVLREFLNCIMVFEEIVASNVVL